MPTPTYGDLARYGREADAYARQFGLTGRHNGDWDAFRHAYASAEMTRQYGSEWARAAGDFYEKYGDFFNGQGSAERNMDLWNNARGRDIGAQSTSSQDSAQRARSALAGGDLINNPTDPRNRYYDDYGVPPNLPSTWEVEGWGDGSGISAETNRDYTAARGWTLPRDPLVLDLDGDGIETVGINPLAPVLFDHDNDGVRTGTGWIKSDDGLLVLDRNGNGTIDGGAELFGDNTPGAAGALAANGYIALQGQDTNADGQINSQDTSYTQLRVWRDLNQDGISQAGELQTLSQAGIASIGVAGTATNVNLAAMTNGCAVGNTQITSGSFTRTNRTTGQSWMAELTEGVLLTGTNRRYLISSCSRNISMLEESNYVRKKVLKIRRKKLHHKTKIEFVKRRKKTEPQHKSTDSLSIRLGYRPRYRNSSDIKIWINSSKVSQTVCGETK